MSKIKIAVIGTGGISNEHIKGYQKNPNVELYAFCDINEKRLNAMGDQYNVEKRYTDKDLMLKELPEIDAVSVCTWNSEHASCSIAALNAGKHVLCEKPMATSAEEAREMKAAAEKNGKLLMIGFVRRFGNDCSIVKDFIDEGSFGDLYYAKATYLRRNGCPGSWFGDKSRAGGGPLIDLGVHVIDLTRYLMGNPKPVSVYGVTANHLGNRKNIKSSVKQYSANVADGSAPKVEEIYDVEDFASAMVRYDNGAVLAVEASFSLNIKHDEGVIKLFGTKAGASLNPELEIYSEMNGYMTNVQLGHPTGLSFDNLFANEINHFVDCAMNGTECIATADDGIVLMQILDAIYESAETKREVVIK